MDSVGEGEGGKIWENGKIIIIIIIKENTSKETEKERKKDRKVSP